MMNRLSLWFQRLPTTGKLLVILEGTNLQEIATFIAEKLSTIKGVISTATRFRLKAYKENGVSLTREVKAVRLAVTP